MNKSNNNSSYRGRFAPTPSGPLHFGSIIAALGSYLQAKKNQGKWLVRIDDIDQARTIPDIDKVILNQLELLGLFWDEEVVYQSKRLDLYQTALEKLNQLNCTFPCCCTRKDIGDKVYTGTCRDGINPEKVARSLRIKTNDEPVGIIDLLQGEYNQKLLSEVGDFIIKRADGYFAYHLATAIDDAEQGITEVVRGIDLLESTPRQVYIQKKLELPIPQYLHLPLAVDVSEKKISKSDNANSIAEIRCSEILFSALNFLNLSPPEQLKSSDVETILNWSIENWDIATLPKEKQIIVNSN